MESEEEAFRLAGDKLGKFTILAELGRGSMGVVYEAFQQDLKRKVALKVLPANIALEAKQVRRFRREAESVARLRHENIIQIYEVGQAQNTHYFVMELIEGSYLGRGGGRDKDSIRNYARLVRDAANGLAHAHEQGIVHRDIKPTNLLVDRAGRVVVTDFGLAHVKDSASLTSTDAIVGTPKYMSPEQILAGSRPLDGRSDLYSLGATLYEVCAGRPPLEAPSVQAFLKAILEERPPSPRRVNREVPFDLATIILRCLEKDPTDRYAGAKELAEDLDRFLLGERIVARPKGVVALGLETVRRHKVISALAVVAGIALALSLWLGQRVATESSESDLLAEINELRGPQEDLDVSIQKAEEMARDHPGDGRVTRLLEDLYHFHALKELEEGEPDFEGVLSDFDRAGRQGTFWHLMVLEELRRFDEAEKAAETLPEGDPVRVLTVARHDLFKGGEADCKRAIQLLEALEGDLHPCYHLALGRAYGRLAQRIAAAEGDEAEVRRYRVAARKRLDTAKELALGIHQRWLRTQIEIEIFEVRARLGESIPLVDAVDDLGAVAANAVSRLTTVWEGMTKREADSLQQFVRSVLGVAGVKIGPPAELERQARLRLRGAAGRERIVAGLLLAVAHLSDGLPELAHEALLIADDDYDPVLSPYVLWGHSLALRAENNVKEAVPYALEAVRAAQALQSGFPDLESLALHTALLVEEARNRKQAEARLATDELRRLLLRINRPAAWVSELLGRLASPADAPTTPPR